MSYTPSITGISRTPVLILAGGSGNRLLPLTARLPKPLLPLGPFRIIDFTLANCQRSGLHDVSILTQYKHDQIANYIRDNWHGKFRCLSPDSGKRYRGTADAVFQNLADLLEQNPRNVLILSADHVYRMDYNKLLRTHTETNADVTISTISCPLSQASSFGVLSVNRYSRVTTFQEKPLVPKPMPGRRTMASVSMGIYVFKMQTLFDALHTTCAPGYGYDFGHDILPPLIDSGRVYAHDFRDEVLDMPRYWQDVGTIDNYYRAAMDLARPDPPLCLTNFGDVRPSSVAGLSGRARVTRTLLCGGVRVEDGAEVEESVLMGDVRVGRGAKLRRVIVEEGVRIPSDFTAGWDLERDRQSHMVSPGGIVVIRPFAIPLPSFQEKTEVRLQNSPRSGDHRPVHS